jgi:ATP-dependent helicase IRC3
MRASLLRSAKWRKQPASDSQKAFISKRWSTRTQSYYWGDGEEGSKAKITTEERIAKMTKGEAANIITRLKHGAQASVHVSGSFHYSTNRLSVAMGEEDEE